MRDTFIKALHELAEREPRIFLITGDLGFGVLDKFSTERPHQFLNAGVAEQNMTGLATGLALEGRVVFTYSIANFPILRPLEQIRNDAAYHDANVNVVAIGGGFSYGQLGMSHHATEDLAIMRALPGLTVVSPGDLWETFHAVEALARAPGTTYLRLDKSNAGWTQRPDEQFVLGKARQLRDGDSLTIVVTGGILGTVLSAAETLAAEDIRCRVLSMHTIKPLDRDALVRAAKETGGILSVEEHVIDGGLGGAIAETLLDAGVAPRRFHRIGLRVGFSSIVGSQEYLRTAYGMDAGAIMDAARKMR
jgi:transketolase